jgi:hypothetical protein
MLYLGYLDGCTLSVDAQGPWLELWELRPGLLLIHSEQSRSTVYHALKDAAPTGTPLLVTRCDQVPKFKGMAAGSLAWARARASDT